MNRFCKTVLLRNLQIFIVLVAGIITLNSCGNTKKLIYMQPDVHDTSVVKNSAVIFSETVIQVDDILSIIVSSANQLENERFNAPNESTQGTNSGAASAGNTVTIGYLVNQNGDIQFPVFGTIHVEGMTKRQLTEKITKSILEGKHLVDPIVTIRFLNFRVSVLGEVSRPGVYTVPNEKLSLLEAIALAGDLTIYGRRDNITLVRENGRGEKVTEKLNLKSIDVLSSPYYYLKSNDIIYVEPIKDRIAMEKSQQLLPIIFSVTSLLIVLLDRVFL